MPAPGLRIGTLSLPEGGAGRPPRRAAAAASFRSRNLCSCPVQVGINHNVSRTSSAPRRQGSRPARGPRALSLEPPGFLLLRRGVVVVVCVGGRWGKMRVRFVRGGGAMHVQFVRGGGEMRDRFVRARTWRNLALSVPSARIAEMSMALRLLWNTFWQTCASHEARRTKRSRVKRLRRAESSWSHWCKGLGSTGGAPLWLGKAAMRCEAAHLGVLDHRDYGGARLSRWIGGGRECTVGTWVGATVGRGELAPCPGAALKRMRGLRARRGREAEATPCWPLTPFCNL